MDSRVKFAESFEKNANIEIVAFISSWIDNGTIYDGSILDDLFCDTMQGQPYEFIIDYVPRDGEKDDYCFVGNLTYGNLNNLFSSLHEAYTVYGGLKFVYESYFSAKNKKIRKDHSFGHNALADFFGDGIGMPTNENTGTFFRYNQFLYWITYKLNVWKGTDVNRILLPCNDFVLERAYDKGYIRKRMESKLQSAILLTDIAKEKYGDGFMKLYEEITHYTRL